MLKVSRRRTREFLLQSLYGRIYLSSSFRRDIFLSSYFEETDAQVLDLEYLDAMEQGILEKQDILGFIIAKLAPKFDIETMSILNLIPMYIALYEAIFLTIDAIPDKVSVNEAIELTKKFSDETGRMLVNGVLSNFLLQRANFPKDMIIPSSSFHLFP